MKKMLNNKIFWIVISVIIVITGFTLFRMNEDTWIKNSNGNWIMHGNPEVKDFDSCAKKYPVLLTYPATCSIPKGPSFTQK